MRIVVVTSEANFVRDNYDYLLSTLLGEWGDRLVGLVLARTVSPDLMAKMAGLYALGVRHVSTIFLKNALRVKFGEPYAQFERAGVPRIWTDDINDDETLARLQRLDPDLIVNVRTREIFGAELLDIPRIGCINVHHGILPKYRGTMCDLWAVYEGKYPGFTIHEMTEEIDQGELLHVHEHEDWESDKYYELPHWSSFEEARALIEVVDELEADGEIDGRPNEAEEVVYRSDPGWQEIRRMRQAGIVL